MGHRPGESEDREGGPDPKAGRGPAERVWVLDRQGLAEVDRLATLEYGIPSFALMENAAAGLAGETLALLRELKQREVIVFCGPGNNGGDGLAAARHLHIADVRVEIVLAGNPEAMRGDARKNLEIVRAMDLPISDLDPWLSRDLQTPAIVIDALFGTGLTRPIEGAFELAVNEINRLGTAGARVIAADTPSGLDVNTGEVLGRRGCVKADLTVTFAALKPGFGRLDTQRVLGEIVILNIGCPTELLDRFGQLVEYPPGHDSPAKEGAPSAKPSQAAGRLAEGDADESERSD